jgi:methionyl-tRNA formyltransferase
VDQGRGRVVIVSVSPEIADLAAATVKRLGHDPVAAVTARRKKQVPGFPSLDAVGHLQETEVVVAENKESLEPVFRSLNPDIAMSWAFPWRIPPDALRVPTLGAINFHPSLLPRHRGPNPLAWTVRTGDDVYGLSWHRMAAEFDSGPILAQRSTPVLLEDTHDEVAPRILSYGLRMLRAVFGRVLAGEVGEPQSTEGVSEAPPFQDDYATVDWSRPVREVHDQVRAWTFVPGTGSADGPFADLGGRRVKILRTTLSEPATGGVRVDCGDGPLWVLKTEPAD